MNSAIRARSIQKQRPVPQDAVKLIQTRVMTPNMNRGGFLLSQYNTRDQVKTPEVLKTEDSKEQRSRSVFNQRNKKLLEEIKIHQK